MRPDRLRLAPLVVAALAAAVAAAVVLPGGADPGPMTTTSADASPTRRPHPPPPAPSPSPEPADGAAVVMWARGGLPPEIAVRSAALPGVHAAAHVRGGTAGLTAWTRADGTPPVEPLADGYRIPVSLAAVDPAQYAATMPAGDASTLVAALRPGTTLVAASLADRHDLGPGSVLDLVGRPGLLVAAVLPDGAVRRGEVTIHVADAEDAGLDEGGSLVLRVEPALAEAVAADDAAVIGRLEALAPADVTVRVVASAARLRAPLVLSLPEVKQRFGEFAFRPRPGVREIDVAPGFVDEHITTARVPILGTVTCHRGIIDDLRATLAEIETQGLAGQIDPARYAGCYYPRRIDVDGDSLSHHSWGIALDVNVDLSLPGLGPPPAPEIVAIFARHGFRWGGDFLHPDNHHFEWLGPAATERPDRNGPGG